MFKRSLKESISWNKKFFFGSISTLIATFYTAWKYFELSILVSALIGIGVFISAVIGRFIINVAYALEEMSQSLAEKDEKISLFSSDKERKKNISALNIYGEAILMLKDGFAKLHDLRKNSKFNNEEVGFALIYMCDQLKNFFDKKTNSECAVSIKVVGPIADKNQLTADADIQTLCRDSATAKKRNYPKDVRHNIFNNTCYNVIFHKIDHPDKSFYINNDLPADLYYENTSFDIWGKIPEGETNPEKRRKLWKLPYKSEIVVPICPINVKAERKLHFLGFLCIDSSAINSFHPKYDVGMIQGVADGIFDIIQIWLDNNKN